MVRHKVRWLLVQFDFDEKCQRDKADFPSKKEVTLLIRQSISLCFGVAAEGAAMDTQVRMVDPISRLILLRVPRDYCKMVRCSLTMLTSTIAGGSNRPALVASVLSVNGSARTAKLSAISRLKESYKTQLLVLKNPHSEKFGGLKRYLQPTLETIQNID